MNYIGIGVIESILDYKFLMEMGLEQGVFDSFNDMKVKICNQFKEKGINVILNDKMGNKYYNGVQEVSRYTALELMTLKLGRKARLNRYMA